MIKCKSTAILRSHAMLQCCFYPRACSISSEVEDRHCAGDDKAQTLIKHIRNQINCILKAHAQI